jgi:hypothetical protein
LLALLLALEVCEFVTPYPNEVWNWRRGSESNRSLAVPLGTLSGVDCLRLRDLFAWLA